MRMKMLGCLLILFSLPSLADAACTGASPTWTSTQDQPSLASCISSSVTGDTINVSAGSTSWVGLSVTIPEGKVLHINGAGVASTIITASQTYVFTISNGSRISNIQFSCARIFILKGQDFRIDNNTFTCGTKADAVLVNQTSGAGPSTPRGLVDHNTFLNQRFLATPHPKTSVTELRNSSHWTLGPQHGTGEGVYLENNTFTQAVGGNSIDCNYSGRFVARFNTFNDAYPETHSVQATHRACRGGEIYNNTMEDVAGGVTPFFMFYIRGGSWMLFNNTITGTWGAGKLALNNIRSCKATGAGLRADGTSGWDENTGGQQGWLARDQIGAGADVSAWGAASDNPPAQGKSPMYTWLNTHNAADLPPSVNALEACTDGLDLNSTHIVNDRDYYTYSTATGSPDTTGVRSGTFATMSAIGTCTNGVGFWATNVGEWNSTNGATPDGQLYKCVSNAWVLYYTPYTYPHPLIPATTPPAPTGLTDAGRIMTFSGNTFAIFTWPASTDAAHKSYNIYRCTYTGACTALVKTITPASAAASYSPETRFFDTRLYTAGTYYYSVSDVNTSDYVGPSTTAVPITVNGKQ